MSYDSTLYCCLPLSSIDVHMRKESIISTFRSAGSRRICGPEVLIQLLFFQPRVSGGWNAYATRIAEHIPASVKKRMACQLSHPKMCFLGVVSDAHSLDLCVLILFSVLFLVCESDFQNDGLDDYESSSAKEKYEMSEERIYGTHLLDERKLHQNIIDGSRFERSKH